MLKKLLSEKELIVELRYERTAIEDAKCLMNMDAGEICEKQMF